MRGRGKKDFLTAFSNHSPNLQEWYAWFLTDPLCLENKRKKVLGSKGGGGGWGGGREENTLIWLFVHSLVTAMICQKWQSDEATKAEA